VNVQGWFAVLYAAIVGTFAAMLLDFYNTKRFGATASAMVSYVIPVIAGLIGVLILNEQFTPGMFAGMALIIVGVWLINRKRVLAVAI
jgi:drug/metabolite transporter (DMT)-like permease